MASRWLQEVSGGSGASAFDVITSTQWGSLNDAGAFVASSSKDTDGTLTFVMAGDTTQYDGYQENFAGFDVLLTDLYADWNDDTDELQLYMEIASLQLTSAKYGLFVGVGDNTYANRASQVLAGAGVIPSTASVTQTAQMAATVPVFSNNGTNLDTPVGMFVTIRWDDTGGSRLTFQIEKSVSGFVESSVVAAATAAMGAVANRRVVCGVVHVSTVTGAPTLSARVWHRRVQAGVKEAHPTLQTKPASISAMVIVGHSIGNGVGADDTTYGGAAIPGTATIRDSGVTLTNYPDNAGAGPDPGVLPYWVADQPLVKIIRQATNGAILANMETVELPEALADCVALSVARSTVDLVIFMIGENDAQNGTESTAYTTRILQTVLLYEQAFPNARIIIQDMASEDGAYSEFAAIRSANAACAALNPTRRKVAAYAGITLNDAVHYNLAGYATAAAAQIAAWDAF